MVRWVGGCLYPFTLDQRNDPGWMLLNKKWSAIRQAIFDVRNVILSNRLFRLSIEDVEIIHVEDDLDRFTHVECRARVDPGGELVGSTDQVEEYLVAHQLGHVHPGIDFFGVDVGRSEGRVVDIFWADSKDNFFINVFMVDLAAVARNFDSKVTGIDNVFTVILAQVSREEVHGW